TARQRSGTRKERRGAGPPPHGAGRSLGSRAGSATGGNLPEGCRGAARGRRGGLCTNEGSRPERGGGAGRTVRTGSRGVARLVEEAARPTLRSCTLSARRFRRRR